MTEVRAHVARRAPGDGFAAGVLIALALLPLAVTALVTRVLAGEWLWPLFWRLFVLFLWALRPAVWALAAGRRPEGDRRRVLYLERRDYTANTALVIMAIAGLAIMDVFRLPGSPHWTHQPAAGLVLAAIAIYLVWVSTYASIPDEVKRGWASLFERKDRR